MQHVACSIDSAVFWAIQQGCWAWQQSRGIVCYRPSLVTRLRSTLFVMPVSAWWGFLLCTPVSPLFRRHPLVSRRLATHPVRLFVFPRAPFRSSCRFPYVFLKSFVPFSTLFIVFCLPPVGAVTLEMAWLPWFGPFISSACCLKWSCVPVQN
jgi:hypothetical protein